jgi:hypothetical protein
MEKVPGEEKEASAVERAHRSAKVPAAAGIAGIVFAVLFVVSVILLRYQPPAGSTAQDIADWYLGQGAGNVILAGLYLAPFAGIAFLWFIGVIRSRVGTQEDQFLATVFLGSGLIFIALFFITAASAGALVAAGKFQNAPTPSPDAVVFARSLSFATLLIYGTKAAAVFMIATSTIGLRTGIFPRWIIYCGYLIALVLIFFVTYFEAIVLVFPVWVAIISVILLTAKRPGPSDA